MTPSSTISIPKIAQNKIDAYPDGIPSDIAYGPDQHLEVRSDQNNKIIFKKGDATWH